VDDFVREHPHPVLIGLGAIGGELQSNPTKAAGTMFLSLSAGGDGGDNGPFVNQVFNVQKVSRETPADGVYVGQSTENDIAVPHNSISKQHAHLVFINELCALVDHGSTNGSYINGSRLEPGRPHSLKGGDIITIGGLSFTYYDATSFAKLLAVQAMYRARSKSSTRTPGAARPLGSGPATPGRPGGTGPTPLAQTQPGRTQLPTQPPPAVSPQGWSPAQNSMPHPGIQPTSRPVPPGMPMPPTPAVQAQVPAQTGTLMTRFVQSVRTFFRKLLGR
jgi:predicted component of type VI protein secretion system